jgi:uncharacterized phage-like protein YoqJ
MEITTMIVAFTGHRPQKLGGFGSVPNPRVVEALQLALGTLQPTLAISGMALGVDQWAAQLCVDMRIPFVAAVPFKGQDDRWPHDSHVYYKELLSMAERVVYTNGTYSGSSADVPALMQHRNEWMVDHCDKVIAVWDGSKGGTANCVRYAKLMQKSIYLIDPREL